MCCQSSRKDPNLPRSCCSPEGELEAEWLQDVGLSTLISGDEEEDGKALLSTLTRTQAAAVKKRYNTYTQTLRKKNKQAIRDVRDVFGVSESPPSDSCEHATQLDSTKEEKDLPGVTKTSRPLVSYGGRDRIRMKPFLQDSLAEL